MEPLSKFAVSVSVTELGRSVTPVTLGVVLSAGVAELTVTGSMPIPDVTALLLELPL